MLERLHEHFKYLEGQIAEVKRQRSDQVHADDLGQRHMTLPGVGPITVSVLAAEMGDGHQFATRRDFAASFGLLPPQYSTDGKVTLLGISKRSDKRLRRLLVQQCARALMQRLDTPSPLADGERSLLARRPANIVACALARGHTTHEPGKLRPEPATA